MTDTESPASVNTIGRGLEGFLGLAAGFAALERPTRNHLRADLVEGLTRILRKSREGF